MLLSAGCRQLSFVSFLREMKDAFRRCHETIAIRSDDLRQHGGLLRDAIRCTVIVKQLHAKLGYMSGHNVAERYLRS